MHAPILANACSSFSGSWQNFCLNMQCTAVYATEDHTVNFCLSPRKKWLIIYLFVSRFYHVFIAAITIATCCHGDYCDYSQETSSPVTLLVVVNLMICDVITALVINPFCLVLHLIKLFSNAKPMMHNL